METSVRRRPRPLPARLSHLALVAGLWTATASPTAGQNIPGRLTDDAFWRLINELSEPGGYFRSDNFVSNEITWQYVIPELTSARAPGGVYMGVGPDQNFTYIVALRPKISFIVDIRRQNMLQHLMYKALMEQSADRAEFLSRLFSRPRPAGLDSTSTVNALFEAYAGVATDTVLYGLQLGSIENRLVKQHGYTLSSDDLRSIEYVFSAFAAAGPDLTYSFSSPGFGQSGWRRMPSYGELMVQADGQGVQRGYLATEANYRALRDMQLNNMIVPLVGDFAGDKTIRAVGNYVRMRSATVTAFYLSNVEQYLFRQNDDWQKFFRNVGTLPVDSASTFIRAVFNNMGFRFQPVPLPAQPGQVPGQGMVMTVPGPRSAQMLGSIIQQVAAFNDGRIQSYYDVIQMSREPVPSPP